MNSYVWRDKSLTVNDRVQIRNHSKDPDNGRVGTITRVTAGHVAVELTQGDESYEVRYHPANLKKVQG